MSGKVRHILSTTALLCVMLTPLHSAQAVGTADGNVPVGTATLPSSQLGVYGGATIGTSYLSTAAPTNGLIVQGNVGVGTTSPQYALDVNGNLNTNSSFMASYGSTPMGVFGQSNDGYNTFFSRNGYNVGGSWNRYDTSSYAVLNQLYGGSSSSAFTIYTSAPSANPISNWTLQFQVSNDGTGYFAGNVGIGTTAPVSSLHVATGGLLSVTGTYGSGATLPAALTGAGTRMFFYPQKAAFRAGYVDGTQWDDANIGAYSVSMGYKSKASGAFAVSIGQAAYATGDESMTLGYSSSASGNYSTALGYATISSGTNSLALGSGSQATSFVSTAMGHYTTASGWYSTAMGDTTTASAMGSTAMGVSTIASGQMSTAMGNTTTAAAYEDVALGQFNVGGGTTASWVATDPVFEIGIGADAANKANAVTVLKNGKVGIGTAVPTQKLTVTGNVDTQSGYGYLTEIANDATTGTTVNMLAKLTSAGAAIIPATTDADGIVGIVVGNAGKAGNAQIAQSGQASCVFDGATTAGDFVTISTTIAGNCNDSGVTRPITKQTIGRVLSTNASAGTYVVALDLNGASGISWPLAGPADTVAAPDYAWAASTNTGLYYNTGIGFTVGGVSVGTVTSTGLNGMAIGVTTPSTGVFATASTTNNSAAVIGTATGASGQIYGLYGTSQNSASGVGVLGIGATGVFGSSSTGNGVAGGTVSTTGGAGVYGSTIWPSGTSYGVYGTAASSSGYGVYGTNTSSGVGGYFSSTSGYALITGAGNVGVGTTAPAHALDVKGTMYSRSYALTDAATIAVDWNNGNVQYVTVAGNRTFTFANGQSGARYILVIKQDATGSRTVTWPATVRWPGATAPTLTTTASKTDYISFIYNGVDSTYDALGLSQNY